MENTINLSIIMPCYNGQKYIETAICSVLNQTMPGIELIVVNDGSTDGTAEVCSKYAGRINYIETVNQGAGHARNVALDAARGKWIGFLDSDDLYLPGSFTEETLKYLSKMDEDCVDVVYTPWVHSDMELKSRLHVTLPEMADEINHIPEIEFWTSLYKREFLEEHRVRFYEYRVQDIATAFRYLVFSKEPKVFVDREKFFYVQRDNDMSNTHTWKHQTLHYVKSHVYQDMLKNHCVEKSRNWLYSEVVHQIYLYFKYLVIEGCRSAEYKKYMIKLLRESLIGYPKNSGSKRDGLYLCASVVLSIFAVFRGTYKEKAAENKRKEVTIQEDCQRILQRAKCLADFIRA